MDTRGLRAWGGALALLLLTASCAQRGAPAPAGASPPGGASGGPSSPGPASASPGEARVVPSGSSGPAAPASAPPQASSPPVRACSPLVEGQLRFGTADVHDRARLVAAAFRADVMVVGDGGSGPIWKQLADIDAGTSYGELPAAPGEVRARTAREALASSWPVVEVGGLLVQDVRSGDRSRRSRPPARLPLAGLPPGEPVELMLDRASTRDVFRLLEEVARLEPSAGVPSGSVTIVAREARAGAVLRALSEVAGDVRLEGKRLAFGQGASFGEAASPLAAACRRRETTAQQPCVASSELHVIGVARAPGRAPVALLGHRLDERARIAGMVARVGDFFGSDGARVASVDCDGVTFEGGSRIVLR